MGKVGRSKHVRWEESAGDRRARRRGLGEDQAGNKVMWASDGGEATEHRVTRAVDRGSRQPQVGFR